MLLQTKRPWVQREGIAQYFMLFVVLSESLLIFGAITIYKHGAPKQDLPFSSQVLRPGLTESFSIFTKALNLANIVRPTLDSVHVAELLHSEESLSPGHAKTSKPDSANLGAQVADLLLLLVDHPLELRLVLLRLPVVLVVEP